MDRWLAFAVFIGIVVGLLLCGRSSLRLQG